MKKMYIIVCLVGWLLCSPVVSLGYGASYDNGGLVEKLKTNAEIKAVADEIKIDMKDAQTIDQSETRRKMWKAYIDNMPTPKDVDWYGYSYMSETYEEKFIPNIVGLIGVGLLFFLVPLSLCGKEINIPEIQNKKKMTKEQIPENAIDRFFYKIGRGFKNAGATVKESQVVGKVIKILFRSGVWSIVAWLALWYVCGWIYMLIEEW